MSGFIIVGDKKTHVDSIEEAKRQVEQHLQPGKDLFFVDDQTECVCLCYRWYPYNPAKENLQYLPKGTADGAIISPDNTGIWLKSGHTAV